MTNEELKDAVYRGVLANGGTATLVQVARYIWEHHESELKNSGDRFFKWQYEMRWAANVLRKEGKLAAADLTPKGVWMLKK